MRELKFRAWKYPYMISDLNLNSIAKESEWKLASNIDDYVITQFTGLKDKNGVDIYEEDIFCDVLSENKGVVKYGLYSHFLDDKRLSQFGNHIGFYVYFENQRLRKDLDYWATNQLILGNIYENPELLKP